MNAQVVEDKEVEITEGDDTTKTHLGEVEWLKNRIRFNVQELQELKYQKQQEKESEEGLSDGRRKHYNREVDKTQEKIAKLDQELEEVSS